MTRLRFLAGLCAGLVLGGCASAPAKPRLPKEARPSAAHLSRAIAKSETDGYPIRGSFATALNAHYKTTPVTRVNDEFDTLNMTALGALHGSQQGSSASDLGKAEDAAHASGDVGTMALAVRKATPANVSGADGDYEPLQVSAGRVWASATIDAALPAGTANIGDVDVASMPADATELPAAAALSDALANPTTPLVGSASLAWDSGGSQWVRGKGDATSGSYVQAHSPRAKTYRTPNSCSARRDSRRVGRQFSSSPSRSR